MRSAAAHAAVQVVAADAAVTVVHIGLAGYLHTARVVGLAHRVREDR
jgi:hypothetical protein